MTERHRNPSRHHGDDIAAAPLDAALDETEPRAWRCLPDLRRFPGTRCDRVEALNPQALRTWACRSRSSRPLDFGAGDTIVPQSRTVAGVVVTSMSHLRIASTSRSGRRAAVVFADGAPQPRALLKRRNWLLGR